MPTNQVAKVLFWLLYIIAIAQLSQLHNLLTIYTHIHSFFLLTVRPFLACCYIMCSVSLNQLLSFRAPRKSKD